MGHLLSQYIGGYGKILGMTHTEFTGVPDPAERPTLTVAEAGRYLGLAKASAYEAVHRGQIPSIRVGRRLLVPTAALRRLLQLDAPGVGGSDAA